MKNPSSLAGTSGRGVVPALTQVAKDAGWAIKTGAYRDGSVWIRLTNPNYQSGQSILYERALRAKQGVNGMIRAGQWYFRVSPGGGAGVARVGTRRFDHDAI